MTIFAKPINVNKIWAAGGDKAAPLDNKVALGWQVEIPPRQWFNWWMNDVDVFLAHLNQFGISQWVPGTGTEYIDGKSYVQGPTTGVIYRCITTHTSDQDPEAAGSTYWAVAFAEFGSGFSEASADSKYMAKASNGADIPSKATFRDNLSVYSKAEVDLATEGAVLTYTSSDLTITNGGTFNLNHGLGKRPWGTSLELVCQTADGGYSPGDVIDPYYEQSNTGGTPANYGVALRTTTTQIQVKLAATSNAFICLSFDGGNQQALTNSRWKVRFKAYAFK